MLKKFLLVTLFSNCTPSNINGVSLNKVTGTSAQTNSITKTNTTTQTQTKTSTSTSATATSSSGVTTVTLTASGYPTNSSDQVNLNITLSGTATFYKYKIVTGSGVCTGGGYGTETPIATKITDNISNTTTYPAGTITVCVIGRITGSYMEETNALTLSWTNVISPIILAEPKVWLRADAGITKDGSNVVTAWADQSGNGNDGNQVGANVTYVASDSTANNNPVVHFAGSITGDCFQSSAFSSALALPNTIIIVAKRTSGIYYYDGGTGARNLLYNWAGAYYANAGANLVGGSPDANWDIISTIYNSTQTQVFAKGTLVAAGDSGSENFSRYSLGCDFQAGQLLGGDIAEFIVYNKQLSTSERQKIEGYLATKYNISVLPSSNQKLWLRADKDVYTTSDCSTTAATANNDAVACWKDQSGQANHVTQTTAASKPALQLTGMNYKPTLLFDGIDDFLNSVGVVATNNSLFAVAKQGTGAAGYSTVVCQVGTPRYLLGGFNTSPYADTYAGDVNYGFATNLVGTSTLTSLSRLISSISTAFYGFLNVNGTRETVTTHKLALDANGPYYVGQYGGGGAFWKGDIAEVLGYSADLTESDRQRVETYLSQKYNTGYTTSPVFDAPGAKLWLKADAGVTTTDNAGQFTAANGEALSIADNANLSTGDIDYSIATWVYVDSKSTDRQIFSKWHTTGVVSEYGLHYLNSGDRFRFSVSNDGTAFSNVQADNLGSPSIGRWYFIVAWHDSVNNVIGIQVNNGTANTTNHTTGSFDSVTSICIGAYGNACNALTFDGRIAKTGFWRKVLTAAEKTALYNSGKGLKYSALDSGLKANLQAYWNLDEASGTRNDSHSTNHLTDNNTVTQAAGPGSSVSAWADQSGHGASAAQATATKRPQWIADGGSAFNNKPVFRFNNSDLTVPSLSVSGFSVFTVANVTTNGILYEQGTGAGAPGFALYTPFASGPNIWAVFGGNTSAYDPNTNWALGAGTKIISHLYNGTHATHTIALNSAAQAFTTNVGNNPGNITSALEFNIGSRDESSLFVGADIAEMIVYNRSLSTTERNAVECYLSVKYNVTLSGVTCP